MTHKTKAWVLHAGEKGNPQPTELSFEDFEFDDISSEEVLVKPLYGCWEGNMGHALHRTPVDICLQRREERVVFGNAGVVEILDVGSDVDTVRVGQKAILFCNGVWDKFGYPKKIFGYDAPGTIGMLALKTKVHQKQVIPIPEENTFDLVRWAAFSLRYVTAWSNFRLAYGTLRLQLTEHELPAPVVWGWGGGVSLGELHLARLQGCRAFQVSSRADRQEAARKLGITAIDRNEISDLMFDAKRYKTDPEYKARYKASEDRFLEIVEELTHGHGVNIFLDYVGSPVIRATLKAMARQGVLATAGWKEGMHLWFLRAVECIDRHQHIHTHYARYGEGVQAVQFAVANEWLPEVDPKIYDYDEIPALAEAYNRGEFTYFPCFRVNAE
ncbi:MAG: NADPH:quinone reductase-like Zn-dependent oxidoreductase [Bradymonadia bacterium]|jgi:NADPH:quinone reductase-like Zn-dependent oxidoreductase